MSNKILAYILIAVVVAAAGIFALWRVRQSQQSQWPFGYQTPAGLKEQAEETGANQPPVQNAPDQMSNACERQFDQAKPQSAKVSIQKRAVEIMVKDMGKIVLEFYDKDAPKTVENFLRLANAGYFDCLTFHRVSKGFVIQGGDPTGTGSGGDSAFGGEFADEINPASPLYKTGYKKGVVAMANRGPDTNTSQFFIMLEDGELPPSYTIFGRVASGQDVVDRIGQAAITPQLGPTDGSPKTPVVMESVKIIK